MIQRYSMWCVLTHGHQPAKSDDGLFVTFADHLSHTQALQGQVEELLAVLGDLLTVVDGACKYGGQLRSRDFYHERKEARSILAAHRGETKP